jgi:hypothetical protein
MARSISCQGASSSGRPAEGGQIERGAINVDRLCQCRQIVPHHDPQAMARNLARQPVGGRQDIVRGVDDRIGISLRGRTGAVIPAKFQHIGGHWQSPCKKVL